MAKSKRFYVSPCMHQWKDIEMNAVGWHINAQFQNFDSYGFLEIFTNKKKFKKAYPKYDPIIMRPIEE